MTWPGWITIRSNLDRGSAERFLPVPVSPAFVSNDEDCRREDENDKTRMRSLLRTPLLGDI
jgi:hypothetical protein